MLKCIAHGAVTVRDMDESLTFYTKALGFEKAFSIPNPETGAPWIEYLAIGGGQFLELFYGGKTENPWNSALIGFNHFCMEVEDIYAIAQQIKDAGYVLTTEPKQGADGNWQAWVTDPNGVRIELMKIDPNSPQAKFYAGK